MPLPQFVHSILFAILFLPILIVSQISCLRPSRRRERLAANKEQQRLARTQARAALVPQPLPLVRARRLSFPLLPSACTTSSSLDPNGVPPAQKTLSQSQSILFYQLPLELRRLIYRFALGDDTMHIVQHGRRLVHIRCKAPRGRRCFQNDCWTYGGWDGGATWPEGYPIPLDAHPAVTYLGDDLTALLRTCRAIYTEAIPILYNTNTLSFNNLPTFLSFPPTILPSRFESIRSLEFKWHFVWPFYQKCRVPAYLHNPITPLGHDEETWENVWKLIAQMVELGRLRDIRCAIMFNGCVVDPEWERRVMKPLLDVGRVRVDEAEGDLEGKRSARGKIRAFRIDVPWRDQGNSWSEAPFDLRHHEPEFEGKIFGMDIDEDEDGSRWSDTDVELRS